MGTSWRRGREPLGWWRWRLRFAPASRAAADGGKRVLLRLLGCLDRKMMGEEPVVACVAQQWLPFPPRRGFEASLDGQNPSESLGGAQSAVNAVLEESRLESALRRQLEGYSSRQCSWIGRRVVAGRGGAAEETRASPAAAALLAAAKQCLDRQSGMVHSDEPVALVELCTIPVLGHHSRQPRSC